MKRAMRAQVREWKEEMELRREEERLVKARAPYRREQRRNRALTDERHRSSTVDHETKRRETHRARQAAARTRINLASFKRVPLGRDEWRARQLRQLAKTSDPRDFMPKRLVRTSAKACR